MEYNGSAIVAMVGKNCVAIASDKRLGQQNLTVACDFKKIFKINDKTLIGLSGLATDVITLSERFAFKTNMYRLREEREIAPKAFSHMVSSTLYEKRFGPYFVEPVIAGLDKDNKPYIASTDLIGCLCEPKDFAVAGVASDALNGLCEAFWEEDLGPEQLFETISQVLLSALDRDCLSGWGAVVHVLTPDELIVRHLKARMD
ncbi:proteasome core particle subunit beta 3 [Massospora cicadina]|nr:proteasome core particle subunit beta 3 [Massospora cicadina]